MAGITIRFQENTVVFMLMCAYDSGEGEGEGWEERIPQAAGYHLHSCTGPANQQLELTEVVRTFPSGREESLPRGCSADGRRTDILNARDDGKDPSPC